MTVVLMIQEYWLLFASDVSSTNLRANGELVSVCGGRKDINNKSIWTSRTDERNDSALYSEVNCRPKIRWSDGKVNPPRFADSDLEWSEVEYSVAYF